MHQPPWRNMAEEALKANDPKRYRQMKRKGELDPFLDDLDSRLRTSYQALVKRIEESTGRADAWALQAAEEMLVNDVLLPGTKPA